MAATDWAFVVGIDEYAEPSSRLKGAVRDALRAREWFCGEGGIPEAQTILSLAANAASPPPPPGVPIFAATRKGIRDGLRELSVRLSVAPRQPTRLFLFFAGHGVTSRMSGIGEQALLAADFTRHDPDNSISVPSLLDWLQALPVPDQFIFVDGCRNAPIDGRFQVGRMPFESTVATNAPIVQQFVFNATSSGLKAFEAGSAGEEGGVFTGELLEALRGRSGARVWDPVATRYIVRWRALTDWVSAKVTARSASLAPGESVQVPRTGGEQNAPGREADPVLAQIDPQHVPDGVLEIDVAPAAARKDAVIHIFDPDDPAHPDRFGPDEDLPLEIELPPRRYAIAGQAQGWRPRRKSWPAVLDARVEVTLEFDPEDPATAAGGPARRPGRRRPSSSRGGGASAGRDLLHEPTGAGGQAPSRLVVRTEDRMARLEILDSAGRLAVAGIGGEVSIENPIPGAYMVRLEVPEGDRSEQVVSVVPGEEEVVTLEAPTRSLPVPTIEQMNRHGLTHTSGVDVVAVSEFLGPMTGVEASTILALAAARAVHAKELDARGGWGYLVAQLGVEPPPATGVQILMADELFGPDGVAAATLQLRRGSSRPTNLRSTPIGPRDLAMAQAQRSVAPGRCTLLLGGPGAQPIEVPIAVIERHVTQVIVHRRRNAEVHILMQTPASHDPRPGAGADFDPHDVRSLESAQRWVLRGRYENVDADSLAGLVWSEPLATLLAAYLHLRADQRAKVLDLCVRLEQWPPLACDGWVIRSEIARRESRPDEDRSCCESALREQPPLFAGGLRLLADAVRRHGVRSRAARALLATVARRVGGVLWTATVESGGEVEGKGEGRDLDEGSVAGAGAG